MLGSANDFELDVLAGSHKMLVEKPEKSHTRAGAESLVHEERVKEPLKTLKKENCNSMRDTHTHTHTYSPL